MNREPSRPGAVRDRLRAGLGEAIRARDRVAVAALRSALAAIDNAEAVDAGPAGPIVGSAVDGGSRHVACGVAGLHAAEVPRRVLSEGDVRAIVAREVTDRRAAAETYRAAGRPDRAQSVLAEADLLAAHLDVPG